MSNYPYIDKYPKRVVDVVKMHRRLGPYPMDPTSVFNTLDELQDYVTNSAYSYAGQIVAVANGDVFEESNKDYSIYLVKSDKSLQPIYTVVPFTTFEDITNHLKTNPESLPQGITFTLFEDGVYNLYTITPDKKIVKVTTSGGNNTGDIVLEPVTWSNIREKPTTIEELGIPEVASVSEVETIKTVDHYHYCENNFYASIVSKSITESFDYLLLELLEDTSFIDDKLLNGRYIIDNYYNAECHTISKPNDGKVVSFMSTSFSFNSNTTKVYPWVDYSGSGNVKIYIDTSTERILLKNNEYSEIPLIEHGDNKLIIEMTGEVTICNIGLGVK